MSNCLLKAFLENSSAIRRYLRRMLVSEQDIEDTLQETYLCTCNAAKSKPIATPRAYFYKVARNIAVHNLKQQKNNFVRYMADIDVDSLLSEGPSVDDVLQSGIDMEMFCTAVDSLPPQCRKAFVLRKLYGCSHREIAEDLGISISTVEKHLAKGLRRCSVVMAAQGYNTSEVSRVAD